MNWQEYIVSNPDIMLGKPCFINTRIPVYLVLEKLGFGRSIDDLLAEYPTLQPKHIQAAFLFASASVNNDVILPIAS